VNNALDTAVVTFLAITVRYVCYVRDISTNWSEPSFEQRLNIAASRSGWTW